MKEKVPFTPSFEPDTLAAGETPLDKAMEILEKEGMA